MPTIINGTDNTAATPALTGTDTDTGVFFPAANTMAFSTGGTERVRVDSAGNVGIGVVPSAWSSSSNALQNTGGALWQFGGSNFYVGQNYYFNGTNRIYTTTAEATEYQQGAGIHRWFTAPSGTAGNAVTMSERMRIDSDGNLLINTTSLYDGGGKLTVNQAGVAWAQSINHTNATNQYFIQFNYNSAQIGRIEGNNTNASYLTTSDYRLKEDIAPMTGALEKVSALKPVTYKWKTDGSDGQGFIAHELQEVAPDAVSGKKDAVNKDGKPVYQGIDTSFLVATLTAAIQELKATVDAQAARIAALENPAAPTPVES
jgi:hypothetical protein